MTTKAALTSGVLQLRSPTGYLAVMFAGSVSMEVALHVVPDWSIAGLPGAALIVLLYLPIAAWLWLRCPHSGPAQGSLRLFLIAALVLWSYAVGLTAVRGEELGITSVLIPVLLLMILLKPPDGREGTLAGDVLAWALVAAAAVTITMESAGVLPSPYDLTDTRSLAWDLQAYWLPLDDIVGIQGRWSGPFVHPNLAGVVGTYLVVFGITRPGLRRPAFVLAGIGILLLTSSRTAQLAAIAGLACVAAAWWISRPSRFPRAVRAAALGLPVLILGGSILARNPSLTGRTDIWPAVFDLWESEPIAGVGQTGFNEAISRGTLPSWAIHGHALWLDAGARFGTIGLLLVMCLTAAAAMAAVRAAYRGAFAGIGVLVAILTAGLTDVSVNWRYLTASTSALLVAVIASQPWGAQDAASSRSPDLAGSARQA